jgi:hypothetical protein
MVVMCTIVILPAFSISHKAENNPLLVDSPEWLVIEGLVEDPLNLTYAELMSFPLVSEVTMLQCVGSGQGGSSVTYNWTGVPFFYLLSMAKVIPGAYRKVVFNATDGFSDSVPLETAMEPTSILALKANGTDLEHVTGFGSGYRAVFPCRWGYKWVKWIKQIIVVDYDYKGTYEQYGLSDEAIRPNCTMPSTYPPIQTYRQYAVRALSNSSITSFKFESYTRLIFNVAGSQGDTGYFYTMFSKRLLGTPYQVYADGNQINFSQTDADSNVYLYFTYTHGINNITINGTNVPLSGDLNLDGVINYEDASLFREAYIVEYNYFADFNQDNVINYKDAALFRTYYIAG